MEEDKKKIKELGDYLNKIEVHDSLPTFEVLKEIAGYLKILSEKEPPEAPEPPEVQKIQIEGVGFLKGDSPTDEHLVELIKPLIPEVIVTEDEIKQFKKDVTPVKGIDYKDGYTPVKGRDYFDGVSPDIDTIIYEATKGAEEKLKPFIPTLEEVEKDLVKLTPQIKNELESLPQEEKLTIDAIKDLRKELDDLKKIKQNNTFMGGLNGLGARELVKDIDLSAQLNGVTTTFNIQAIWNVVSVSLSSYPYGSLRKNIDYTWTPTSITFTSEIDPVTQLSAGQKCILTVVQA